MPICPKCKHEVPKEWKFCKYCGNKLNVSEQNISVPNNNRYTTMQDAGKAASGTGKKSKLPLFIAAGIALCLAAGGTGFAVYKNISSKNKTEAAGAASSLNAEKNQPDSSAVSDGEEAADSAKKTEETGSANSSGTQSKATASAGQNQTTGTQSKATASAGQNQATGTQSQSAQAEEQTSAGQTSSMQTDAQTSEETSTEADCLYRCGIAASDGKGVYFWQYNSGSYESTGVNGYFTANSDNSNTLVYQAEDGTITKILNASGEGAIAVTNDHIYFEAPREGYVLKELYSCNLDGTDLKDLGKGNVCGVTDHGNTLIYASGDSLVENLHSIQADGTDTLLGEYTFVAVTDEKVICFAGAEDSAAWKKGQLSIIGCDSDGQNRIALCTTAPDLYDGDDGNMGSAVVGESVILNNYLYFSYGAFGGSGGFWQGGRIMKTDLSPLSDSGAAAGSEVVSGSERVGEYFSVNEDGTVNINSVDVETQATSGVITYINEDETNDFKIFNRKTGDLNAVISCAEYSSFITKPSDGYLDAMDGVRIGDKCYLLLASTIVDSGSSYGWHIGEKWQKMVMLEKDLTEGTITEIYEFGTTGDVVYPEGATVQSSDAAASTDQQSAADPASSEYIFPDSDSRQLTEADIKGMSSDDIQMAINEIYARHGRQFTTPSVKEYFESKSWYKGTIDPSTFDANVSSYFNSIEDANIKFLASHM